MVSGVVGRRTVLQTLCLNKDADPRDPAVDGHERHPAYPDAGNSTVGFFTDSASDYSTQPSRTWPGEGAVRQRAQPTTHHPDLVVGELAALELHAPAPLQPADLHAVAAVDVDAAEDDEVVLVLGVDVHARDVVLAALEALPDALADLVDALRALRDLARHVEVGVGGEAPDPGGVVPRVRLGVEVVDEGLDVRWDRHDGMDDD
jgi:hypothetical protein